MTPICRVCGEAENYWDHYQGFHPFDPMPESGRIGMARSQNRNQLGNEVMGRVCEHKFDGDLEDRYMVCEKKKLDAEIRDLKERLEKIDEVSNHWLHDEKHKKSAFDYMYEIHNICESK